jgi:hypothetical protein
MHCMWRIGFIVCELTVNQKVCKISGPDTISFPFLLYEEGVFSVTGSIISMLSGIIILNAGLEDFLEKGRDYSLRRFTSTEI